MDHVARGPPRQVLGGAGLPAQRDEPLGAPVDKRVVHRPRQARSDGQQLAEPRGESEIDLAERVGGAAEIELFQDRLVHAVVRRPRIAALNRSPVALVPLQIRHARVLDRLEVFSFYLDRNVNQRTFGVLLRCGSASRFVYCAIVVQMNSSTRSQVEEPFRGM